MAPAPSTSAVANQQVAGFSPPVSSSGDKSDRVSGGMCTLPNTPAETAADSTNKNRSSSQPQQHPNFGGHTLVSTSGNFPSLGSTLGPYFCLGRLGKGTFCSIHRCINLNYYHGSSDNNSDNKKKKTAKSTRKILEFLVAKRPCCNFWTLVYQKMPFPFTWAIIEARKM
jgi:hypothetical protein